MHDDETAYPEEEGYVMAYEPAVNTEIPDDSSDIGMDDFNALTGADERADWHSNRKRTYDWDLATAASGAADQGIQKAVQMDDAALKAIGAAVSMAVAAAMEPYMRSKA